MSDVDTLIQLCCAVPTDSVRRGILADKLAEMGEPECEDSMRSDNAELVVRECFNAADLLKQEPSLRLLSATIIMIQLRDAEKALSASKWNTQGAVVKTGRSEVGEVIEIAQTLGIPLSKEQIYKAGGWSRPEGAVTMGLIDKGPTPPDE